MKKLFSIMLRDLCILIVASILWLPATSIEVKIAASLLISFYVAVELARTVYTKGTVSDDKWVFLFLLALIEGLNTYFLWKDIPILHLRIKILLFFIAGWKVLCQRGIEKVKKKSKC